MNTRTEDRALVMPTFIRRKSATKPMPLSLLARTHENIATSFSRPCSKVNYFLSTKYRGEERVPESYLALIKCQMMQEICQKSQRITWKPSTVLISTTLSDSTPNVSRNFWRKSLTWCLYGDIIANRELDLSSGYLETSLWYIASTNSTSSTFCQEPLPDGWDSFPSCMSKKQKGPKQRYSCQERFVCSSTSGPSSRASL